jgi:hypothetical protein
MGRAGLTAGGGNKLRPRCNNFPGNCCNIPGWQPVSTEIVATSPSVVATSADGGAISQEIGAMPADAGVMSVDIASTSADGVPMSRDIVPPSPETGRCLQTSPRLPRTTCRCPETSSRRRWRQSDVSGHRYAVRRRRPDFPRDSAASTDIASPSPDGVLSSGETAQPLETSPRLL